MKHEFLDYYITLGMIVIYVTIATIFNTSPTIWVITIGCMMLISYFMIVLQPVAKLIEIQNLREDKQ